QQPLERLRQALGARAGTALYLQARGIADDAVQPITQRQSISKETTFGEDVTDEQQLRETLRWAAQEVGYLARHQALAGALVTLKLRLQPFETHSRSRTLSHRTASDQLIFQTAWELFASSPWRGRPVRLIGVGLSGWEPDAGPTQPDLFAAANRQPATPANAKLDQTLDAIRNKLGDGLIQRGMRRS
ncbi:DNA polymerase Y family protein, partial [Halochromatium sp.]